MPAVATPHRQAGLEDVHEEDESLSSSPEPDAGSRKFSTSSSVGDGWASARRLGEAGVRRSSDTSVVLTEDTDSFIIGDRVWVGGTKPGKIAYIGATQFAPGEWAGVVLDDPVGKNDGSVAGIRYFQCEARRGVFSRLTRLTRTPLPGGGAMALSGLGANGAASGTSSPSPSRPRSALVSPASSINNLSLRGGSKSGFKVGDRVIVMSSMGSKAGVLRYMGATDFATGEWCGVELDDPLGKNDGSVAGRRYFDCQPKFGLFAPSHKVSKSPSSRRPSAACAVHHPATAAAGAPGSNLPVMKRGGGSRESLASSVASSAVSSVRGARVRLGVTSLQKTGVRTPTTPASRASLQDTLKEKDAQIERLLQERKLDREEVVRAASQIEETEIKFVMMREEFDKYRTIADTKLRELQDLLARVQQEKSDVASQLDDEKRKVEDLQFRFEEERIMKGDIEKRIKEQDVAHSEQAATLAALEAALAAERTRVETLERDGASLFEAAEAATRAQAAAEAATAAARMHATDADTLRAQLARAAESTSQLAQRAGLADQEHRAAIEALLNEKETVRLELTTQLKETIAAHNEEMSALRKQLKESDESRNSQLTASNQRCGNLEEQLASLRKQLEDAQNVIRLKSEDLEKGSEATQAIENLLKGQVEEVRAALSNTSQELATSKSASIQKDQQLEELKTCLLQAENSLKMKTLELESLIESTDQQLAEIQIKAQETGILLVQKSEELTLTTKASEEKLSQKDSILHKMEEKCKVQESEIELVQQKLKELKLHFEVSQHDLQTSNIKILEEKDTKLGQLSQSLAEKEIIVSQLQSEVSKQNSDLKEKDFLVQKRLEEISGMNEKLSSFEVARVSLNNNVQRLELEVGDLKRNLKAAEEKLAETNSQKLKLEQDIAELMSTSSDSSLQLSKLNSELRDKEHKLEKVKEEARANLREKEASCQKLEQALEQAVVAQQTLEKMIDQVKKDSSEVGKMAEEKLRDAETRQLQLEGELQEMQKNLLTLELEYKEELIKLAHESEAVKEEITSRLQKSEELVVALEEELNKIKMEATAKEEEVGQEISVLLSKLHAAEEDSKNKDSEFLKKEEEIKTRMAEIVEEARKLEENLKLSHQEEIESLKLQLAGVESAIVEKDAKLASVIDELSKLKQEKDNMNIANGEKDSKLLEVLKELQKVQELKSLADNSILEKSSDIEELTYNLNKAKQENEELEKHIMEKNMKITSLEQEFKETISEKERLKNLIMTTETELSKVSKAFSILKEAHTLSNLSTAENESKLQSLLQDVSDLTRVKESLQGKLRDTSEMLMDATTQLASLQEEKVLLLKVSEELETLKISFDEHKKTLSEQLEEARKEAEAVPILKQSLEKEKQQNIELKEKLEAISKENLELSQRCIKLEESSSSMSVSETQMISLEKELESISKREEEFKLRSESEKSVLVTLLEQTKEQLAKKEKENQSRTSELSKLQDEISKTKQYKSVLEKLETEKEELKLKVSVMKVNVAESQANANSTDSSYVKLIEEKELAQSQIDFLNSVIVDMQQKNVALKTRLEVLEMGILPSDASDLIEEGITKRVLPPRLFCDICDEFDLHDTEDCPRQATGSPTPPNSNHKHTVGSRSNMQQERPYCDICETFGHSTEDCDDAETF